MDCSACNEELITGPKTRYETLDEHASDPNGTRPFRFTMWCKNPGCETFQRGYWGIDGSWYPINRGGEYLDNIPDIEQWGWL